MPMKWQKMLDDEFSRFIQEEERSLYTIKRIKERYIHFPVRLPALTQRVADRRKHRKERFFLVHLQKKYRKKMILVWIRMTLTL